MSVLDTEEDASKLKFGKVGVSFFGMDGGVDEREKEAPYLTNEELYSFLSRDSTGNNETLEMTRRYLENVTATKVKEDIETMALELRTRLKNTELMLRGNGDLAHLHVYEMSSLSNMIKFDGATPSEAIAWIPSLARFDEDDIQKVIDIVVDAKSRVNKF